MDLSNLLNQTTINNNNNSKNITDIRHNITSKDKLVINNNERFQMPWNKLEKGTKMNRLLIFIDSEKNNNNLSNEQTKKLKNLLFKACDDNMLNKITDVKYDIDSMIIESIKILEFNEETKQYKIRRTIGKQRSISKSKSQLDRLMKKKN